MNRRYGSIACFTTILLCISVTGPSLHAAFQDTVNLLQASKKGDLKLVQQSIKNGANINVRIAGMRGVESNMTPLMLSAKYGHKQLVQYLVDNGAIISLKNPKTGMTAIDYAKANKHTAIIKILASGKRKNTVSKTTENRTASKKYLTLTNVSPKQYSYIQPGDIVSLHIAVNIPEAQTPGPCTLETIFDHTGFTRQAKIDTNIIEPSTKSLKLKYTITHHDLAHLRYGKTFNMTFRVLCPDKRFKGKFKTVFQKLAVSFRDGQKYKNKEQKRYAAAGKRGEVYSHRTEYLSKDKIIRSHGIDLILKKEEPLVYQQYKYVPLSGVLKSPVTINAYNNSLLLMANKRVFFTEKGNFIAGTLAKKTTINSNGRAFVLAKGSSFQFTENAHLEVGTIAEPVQLTFAGKEYTLPAGSRVGLDSSGNARIVIISKPINLTIGKHTYLMPVRTQLQFYKSSVNIREIYNAKSPLTLFAGKRRLTFDNMHGIVLYDTEQTVNLGLLRKGETFHINNRKIRCKRSVVYFNRDGTFKGGKLFANTPYSFEKHTVVLKKDTTPNFYPNGNLQYAYFAKHTYIKTGPNRIYFKKDLITKFSPDGRAYYGQLAKDQLLTVGKKSFLFAGNTLIRLHPNGVIQYGIAARQATITIDGQTRIIRPGEALLFENDGSFAKTYHKNTR